MRFPLAILATLSALLTSCGGGGGGGNTATPPPQPPPVVIVDHYTAAWYDRGGTLAAQGDTWAKFEITDNLRLTLGTIYGNGVCYPTNSTTGWRGTSVIGGKSYDVWFWPTNGTMFLSESGGAVHNFAVWNLTLIAAPG